MLPHCCLRDEVLSPDDHPPPQCIGFPGDRVHRVQRVQLAEFRGFYAPNAHRSPGVPQHRVSLGFFAAPRGVPPPPLPPWPSAV